MIQLNFSFLVRSCSTIRSSFCLAAVAAGAILCRTQAADAAEPYHGTIFIAPEMIRESDPTSLEEVTATGTGKRRMFDRRVDKFKKYDVWLFEATFTDSNPIEVQVNREFDQEEARRHVDCYLPAIGRIPQVLRSKVETIWIHPGMEPFGGGNQNLLIHTEQGEEYIRDGILEETFCHEASHTSLDDDHAAAAAWQAAQAADPTFISVYARENPTSEDIAESFVPFLIARYRSDRCDAELKKTIERAIPNRLRYFDQLKLDLRPMVPKEVP